MSTTDVPKGSLITGAVGSFMAAAAFIVFYFVLFSPAIGSVGSERAMAAFAEQRVGAIIVCTALFGLGNLIAFAGYSGLAKVYSGTAIVAGIFGILFGAAGLFLLLVMLLKIVAMGEAAIAAFGITLLLANLFAPIGLFPTNGLGKGAGALLLASGLVLAFVTVAVLAQSRSLAMIIVENRTIFGLVAFVGAGAAQALAGASMLTAKPKA